MTIAFQIDAADNVATLLGDAEREVTLGGAQTTPLSLAEPIAQGHKVAVRPIACGEPVMKFGTTIGTASAAIATGAWVHLHNCRSLFDERSGDFDLTTGAAGDIRYD